MLFVRMTMDHCEHKNSFKMSAGIYCPDCMKVFSQGGDIVIFTECPHLRLKKDDLSYNYICQDCGKKISRAEVQSCSGYGLGHYAK